MLNLLILFMVYFIVDKETMHNGQETVIERDVNQERNTNHSNLENPYSLSHAEGEIIR